MSKGKYSPNLGSLPDRFDLESFRFNAYGKEPDLTKESYDEKTMFTIYDREGYDIYGYSAFDAQGNYSKWNGVDRNGKSEFDYLTMSDDEFSNY